MIWPGGNQGDEEEVAESPLQGMHLGESTSTDAFARPFDVCDSTMLGWLGNLDDLRKKRLFE
jgi:hypothetical protein